MERLLRKAEMAETAIRPFPTPFSFNFNNLMRLFTAIEIPEDIREQLTGITGGVPGARWQDEDNMHLTLRFIGDVDPRQAEDIDDALASIAAKPFGLTLSGLGTFGDPVRVLWAGVQKSDPLLHLQDKVDSALSRMRIDFDRKKFIPHVTLARFPGGGTQGLAELLRTHADFITEPFPVTHFVLYSSHRGHTGVTYTPERYYIF